MYEWPTTQPMSLVVNMVSPGATQKMCASTPPAPPRSRRCRAARLWACPSCPTCRGCTKARSTRATCTAPARRCARARSCGVVEVAARRRAASRIEPAVDDDDRAAADAARGAAASSTSACTATALPPRMPASAVTMTFGCASSMRVARLAAAKPPNTTRSGSRRCARRRASRTRLRESSACRSSTRSPRPTPSGASGSRRSDSPRRAARGT